MKNVKTARITRTLKLEKAEEAKVHKDMQGGREWLRVSTIILKEGVYHGVYYPKKVIQDYRMFWESTLVIAPTHPKNWELAGSEENRDMVIGRMMNMEYANDYLRGEALIDINLAKNLEHGALIERLEAGENVAVSSSDFIQLEYAEGNFDGKDYFFKVTKVILADHVAILAEQDGACSLDDGCGTNRKSVLEDKSIKFMDCMCLTTDCSCNQEKDMSEPTQASTEAKSDKTEETKTETQPQTETQSEKNSARFDSLEASVKSLTEMVTVIFESQKKQQSEKTETKEEPPAQPQQSEKTENSVDFSVGGSEVAKGNQKSKETVKSVKFDPFAKSRKEA